MLKLFFLLSLIGAWCQTSIVLTDPRATVPIGIPYFCKDNLLEKELSEAVERNLQISGYFNVKPKESYIQRQTRCSDPRFIVPSDWSVLGVQYVVTGVISQSGENIEGQFYLIDTNKGLVLGKSYSGPKELERVFAHKFSNEILKYFTGESGPFGSEIIYTTKVGRFKELAIMDMDGHNQRILTATKGLANSPNFDSKGKKAVYTDFRKAVPDVFIIDLLSKAVKQVTSTRDQEFSPVFLSDDELVVALANPRGGSSLVVMDTSGNILKTLVSSLSDINVSPAIDKVNRYIYFVSDEQTGRPQVYRMPFGGGLAQRVSNVPSNYCSSPSVSPKGDRIAFVCRFEGGFNLFVAEPDGSNPSQLTSFGRNEDPSWSPDGRYIAFSSSAARGINSISIIRHDGRAFTTISKPFGGGDFAPDWGPVLY
ncbi:MAG: hypothetical protein NZT61_07365 [Deltaproteobacteria bacterium]|nr:hypothetical protein [Deltaproteobacteria bacterium]